MSDDRREADTDQQDSEIEGIQPDAKREVCKQCGHIGLIYNFEIPEQPNQSEKIECEGPVVEQGLFAAETIQEEMLGGEENPTGLIDEVWHKCLEEYGDDSDVEHGMKVLARELKYRFQDGEVFSSE